MPDPHTILWVFGGVTAITLLAVPATGSGPMTCPTCGYPLVDPEDPACPQCAANAPAALNTESWDLAHTLNRRRTFLHGLILILAAALAGAIWLVAATLPVTWRESGQIRLEPESKSYRLMLSADTNFRQTPGSDDRMSPATELRLSVARQGSTREIRWRPGASEFVYASQHDGATVIEPMSVDSIRKWFVEEAGLPAASDIGVEREVIKLGGFVANTTPATRWSDVRAAAIVALAPQFQDEGETVSAAPTSAARTWWPAGAAGVWLVGAAGVELLHRRRRRALDGQRRRRARGPMPAGRVQSILFTDMVSYTSKVAGMHPDDILALIREYRGLVASSVATRNGRIVKEIGDAYVLAFDAPDDAVRTGLELQRAVRLRNASVAPIEQFELRVGISSGEVAEEGGDVFGPTVNTAARVQSTAEPGEVLFTEATFRGMGPSGIRVERRGAYDLKGIANKVVIFAAREADRTPFTPGRQA